MQVRVLLVEDSDVDARLIEAALTDVCSITRTATLEAARTVLKEGGVELVLLDVSLPDGDGLEFLSEILQADAEMPVVFVTAANDARSGIAALRGGAREYLVKDADYLTGLCVVVDKVLDESRVREEAAVMAARVRSQDAELRMLREQLGQGIAPRIIGEAPATKQLREQIELAAATAETVLVTGETGTGKELVARAIHDHSPRSSKPFIAVNCAVLPEALIESELFGHARGAFTGADRAKIGFFEAAAGGTLFLDEVGDLAPAAQTKLLRVLQEGVFTPVGATAERDFTGRLVAATNVDLRDAVEGGRFREDLFYRLHVIPVAVPTLRGRAEDIPLLAASFVKRYNERNDSEFGAISDASLELLDQAAWPGNVRQLENFITRVLAMTPLKSGPVAVPEPLVAELELRGSPEARDILGVLQEHMGSRQAAAAALGISRTTLWRKMQRYGIAEV